MVKNITINMVHHIYHEELKDVYEIYLSLFYFI